MSAKMALRQKVGVICLALAAMVWPATRSLASVELVVNGGFGSLNFAGWTAFGAINADASGGDAVFGGQGLVGFNKALKPPPAKSTR
jgi:hypothetical protein